MVAPPKGGNAAHTRQRMNPNLEASFCAAAAANGWVSGGSSAHRGRWGGVCASQRDPDCPGVLGTASLLRPITHRLSKGSDSPNLPDWQHGRHRGLYSQTSAVKRPHNLPVIALGVGGGGLGWGLITAPTPATRGRRRVSVWSLPAMLCCTILHRPCPRPSELSMGSHLLLQRGKCLQRKVHTVLRGHTGLCPPPVSFQDRVPPALTLQVTLQLWAEAVSAGTVAEPTLSPGSSWLLPGW